MKEKKDFATLNITVDPLKYTVIHLIKIHASVISKKELEHIMMDHLKYLHDHQSFVDMINRLIIENVIQESDENNEILYLPIECKEMK